MKRSDSEFHPSRRRFLAALGALALSPAVPSLAAEGLREPIRRVIPGGEERLPVIGLNAAEGFDPGRGRVDRQTLAEILGQMARIPGSLVDTSPMHGGAEAMVGALSRQVSGGKDLFLASKVWARGRDEGAMQLQQSEGLLGRGRLDLMQVHNLVDWRNQLRSLKEWQAQGRVRHIGVTHHHRAAFDAIEGIVREQGVDFIQINYSLAEPEAAERLLPLARDSGVAVIVNRPLSGGYLMRRLGGRPLPGWASEIGCATWEQLLLKYAISHPAVTCAVTGAETPERMAEYLLAGLDPLPDRGQQAGLRALLGEL
jgi:diketogulonate reductase-like aldo/keto reductase